MAYMAETWHAVRTTRAVCWALLAAAAAGTSGCAVRILAPTQGATISGLQEPVAVPVEIEVTGPVFNRRFVITGGPPETPPVVLSDLSSRPATGPFGGVVYFGTTRLPFASNYALTARGEANNPPPFPPPTVPWQLVDVHRFSVVPSPSVALAVTPDPILVPRKGSASVNLAVTRAGSTNAVTVTASGLPPGVALSPATVWITAFSSGQGASTTSANASATASGSAQVLFKASLSGATDATVRRTMKVVPEPGLLTWARPPSIIGNAPDTPSSPDGRFTTTVARTGPGFSRDWTFTITPTGGTGSPLTVTAASWPLRSNIMGIRFCPGNPTTSALVLSDADESADTSTHAPEAIYRYKIIDLRGATPTHVGNLEDLRYEAGVLPWHAFSPDCSMVGSWTTDSTHVARVLTFANAFDSRLVASTSVGSALTDPSPSFTATIAGQKLTILGPSLPPTGQVFTIP